MLHTRIHAIRERLEASDHSDIGMIAPPCVRDITAAHIPAAYADFLRIADGAVCGVILLFESEDILKKQAPAMGLPGGRTRWFCIGSVEEKSLIMDLRTNAVNVLDPDAGFDPDEALGDLEHFLLNYVFGPDYAEFVVFPEDDPWFALITDTQ